MTLILSNHAKTAMGFCEFGEQEALSACFRSITVYELRGINPPTGTTEVVTGHVAGAHYSVAACTSLNEGCKGLIGDVFAEKEDEWREQNKTEGPFMLIQVGPTAEHTCASGWKRVADDASVITYDCFAAAREELGQLEARVLPPVVSAQTCVLGKSPTYATLRELQRASVGRTVDGILIRDIRITGHAEAYVSHALTQPELCERLKLATDFASKLDPRVSRFFSLGLAENDQLKRFLYFFLALEVETHATFKRIDHARGTRTLLSGSGLQGQRAAQLLQAQIESLKNLSDKFVWCATCVWSKLEQSDVEQFKRLKKVRDDIAHGNESEPRLGSALEAEHLARKVLWGAR